MLSLRAEQVTKSFPGLAEPVLRLDSLAISPGERIAVTGGSGSGKSTFINVAIGLERVTSGTVSWDGKDITRFSETARDRWRAGNVGLVMQDFHLFPGLSALENVLLPSRLARVLDAGLMKRAHELLEAVALSRRDQKIETMSRGEMQRVAIARALLRRPGLIVADEPTASLDAEAGDAVGRLLLDMAAEAGSTMIVVSHDTRLIDRLDRRIVLRAGCVVADSPSEEAAA